MNRLWLVASLTVGGLAGGCSEEGAEPVVDVETSEDVDAEAETGSSSEPAIEDLPTSEEVALSDLIEVESVEASGGLLTTMDGLRLTPHDVTIVDEQAIQTIVDAMQQAERGEPSILDIGPSMTLVFNGPVQSTGPYLFFYDDGTAAFEKPDDSGNRYYLPVEQMNTMKEVLYSVLEEEIGDRAGVRIFAVPAEIPMDAMELSLTVENGRAQAYAVGGVDFKKLTEDTGWEPFLVDGSVLGDDVLTCAAFETCTWALDLSAVTAEWTPGAYALSFEDQLVAFHVREAE